MQITNPTTAIANKVAKAMFTPLLSSASLTQLASVETIAKSYSYLAKSHSYLAKSYSCLASY